MATPNYYAIDSFDKLFCKCDGTGASFVDSSTANVKAITPNGNATQLPIKFNKSAGFFNGTTDYVVVPDSADFDFASTLTFEVFLNFTSVAGDQMIYNKVDGSPYQGMAVQYSSGNGIILFLNASGGVKSWAWSPSVNTWYHLMVLRTGGVFHCYINAVEIGTSFANTDAVSASTSNVHIGSDRVGTGNFFGWMKELRVSNVARTVAVPTTEYTTDANTVLLMHFDTPATSPLAPAISFNGSSNLSVTTSTVGTSDFKIEGYYRFTSTTGTQDIFGWGTTQFQHAGNIWGFYMNGSKIVGWTDSIGTLTNRWYAFKIQRVGTSVTLTIDSLLKDTQTSNANLSATTLTLGDTTGGGVAFNGLLREFKLTIGSAVDVYIRGNENNGATAIVDTMGKTVTNPSSLSVIKYVEDFNSCIFKDETGKFPYPQGSAKVDFFAIGSGVGYFPTGTSNNISTPDSDDFDFQADVTMEAYARPIAVDEPLYICGQSQDAFNGTVFYYYYWSPHTLGYIVNVSNSSRFTLMPSFTAVANTWYHFAMTRHGNDWTIWVNGTSIGTTNANPTLPNFTGNFTVGQENNVTWGSITQGTKLLDNIRISKGVARYTTSFNPPEMNRGSLSQIIWFG